MENQTMMKASADAELKQLQKELATAGVLAKTFEKGVMIAQKKMNAEIVPNEVFNERLSVCANCEFKGNVLVEGLEIKGCTICSCPFATKLKFAKHYSFIEMKLIETKCPLQRW